jgi:hypothetical protein
MWKRDARGKRAQLEAATSAIRERDAEIVRLRESLRGVLDSLRHVAPSESTKHCYYVWPGTEAVLNSLRAGMEKQP